MTRSHILTALAAMFAGAVIASAILIPAFTWLSPEQQDRWDACIIQQAGNTVVCDAIIRYQERHH